MTNDQSRRWQPEFARRMTDAGWKFEWCGSTGFVSARHPLGGVQSIVEVRRVGRTGFDFLEAGTAIAAMLNGQEYDQRSINDAAEAALFGHDKRQGSRPNDP